IDLPERNLHVFSLNRQRDRRHRASSHVIAVIGRPSCKRGILRLGVLAPRVFLQPRNDVSSGMLKPMTAMSRDHGDDGDFSTGAVSVVLAMTAVSRPAFRRFPTPARLDARAEVARSWEAAELVRPARPRGAALACAPAAAILLAAGGQRPPAKPRPSGPPARRRRLLRQLPFPS